MKQPALTCAFIEMMPHGAGGCALPSPPSLGMARYSLASCSAEYRMTSKKRASDAVTSLAGNHLRIAPQHLPEPQHFPMRVNVRVGAADASSVLKMEADCNLP